MTSELTPTSAPPEGAPSLEDAPSPVAPEPDSPEDPRPSAVSLDPRRQLRLKTQGERLTLHLPHPGPAAETLSWGELVQQLKQRLDGGDRFWPQGAPVWLLAQDRLLDVRQLLDLAEALKGCQLVLKWVLTSRRQTAMAAVTIGCSVEQIAEVNHLVQPAPTERPLEEPLYVQTTVRSGVEIRHPGTIVVVGDVNPGGSLVAAGDIVVWGRLRGLAQAGSQGNRHCRIMALHMQPTQLRIADLVARPPDAPPAAYVPEVAYIGQGTIRIAVATDFARQQIPTP